ncbi:MAG: right-handed parallel beta-helix repeat-containing protein, partial [Planctomycetota bacterium]
MPQRTQGSSTPYVTGNISSNNHEGIRLNLCNNNTVNNNCADWNTKAGISLRNGSHGNTLADNTANSTGTYGIVLIKSDNNVVTGNMSGGNIFGIQLREGSDDNEVYSNNFIDNNMQAQVKKSSGNVFDLDAPTGGNYWSDHTGPDADGDGFIDVPYGFDGGQDNLPLVGIFTVEGTDVEVTPRDSETGETPVTITFAEVTESGGTSLTISESGPEPPTGFELAGEYYDISTTASYTGDIEVRIQYDDAGLTA